MRLLCAYVKTFRGRRPASSWERDGSTSSASRWLGATTKPKLGCRARNLMAASSMRAEAASIS